MSDQLITLDFIGRQRIAMHAEPRPIRAVYENLPHLIVGQTDWNRKFGARLAQVEARLVDQTDSLVSGFKGRIGISQSMIERRADDINVRVEELEPGKPRFSP